MLYERPPWRTGEDERERVLAWALSKAAARPEIADELGRGYRLSHVVDDVTRVVSPHGEAVFAAANKAESRYRELAGRAQHDINSRFLYDHPLIAELLSLVVIPSIAFSALGFAMMVGGGESPLWPVLLFAAASLAAGTRMLWHKRLRDPNALRVKLWAVAGVLVTPLAAIWLVVDWVGWSAPWLLLKIAVASGPPFYVAVLLVLAVFPLEDEIARHTAALDAFNDWRDTVLREGVLPVMFTKINAASSGDNYRTTLIVRGASELSRTNPLSMHVETPASRELDQLVGRLGGGGGSIALAGPRGAGKSNLLRAFCDGRYRTVKRRQDLAVLVSAPVEYVPHEFVLHLFGATCRAAIGYVQQLDPLAAKQAEHAHRGVPKRIPDDLRHGTPTRLVELATAAHANLVLVRYVLSYTRENNANGNLKGFEFGGRRAVNMQGRVLTYPELVERFRGFLQDAVSVLDSDAKRHEREPGRVMIGIDELDRLGAGEPARRFLNEVKAIFDVSGCYYLVTVSTEAQHDFELSGMGLRSVFDSAFDEVVRVDYLDFEHAKKLLRRYVIGLSEQFLALAYLLSGGLARQLVRTARAISEHNGESLGAVAATLAGTEVLRTCHVTADVLASCDDRGGVTQLLRMLDDPPTKVTGHELRTYAECVLAAYQGTSERVGELRDVVGARMYFLATVLEVFTEDLTRDRMLSIGKDFDSLARARRYLGVSPTTGLELINAFVPTLDRA